MTGEAVRERDEKGGGEAVKGPKKKKETRAERLKRKIQDMRDTLDKVRNSKAGQQAAFDANVTMLLDLLEDIVRDLGSR